MVDDRATLLWDSTGGRLSRAAATVLTRLQSKVAYVAAGVLWQGPQLLLQTVMAALRERAELSAPVLIRCVRVKNCEASNAG